MRTEGQDTLPLSVCLYSSKTRERRKNEGRKQRKRKGRKEGKTEERTTRGFGGPHSLLGEHNGENEREQCPETLRENSIDLEGS